MTHLGLRAPTLDVGSVPLLAGHSIPNARLRASVDVFLRRHQAAPIVGLVTAKAFRLDQSS